MSHDQPRIVEVRQNILKHNDQVAARAARALQEAGVFVVSLVSSPGSGKTAFLEKTLTLLKEKGYRPAALVGDLATENDADRLARSQAPVKQITTGTLCHLEAAMIAERARRLELDELDFLFIENVGNLVCPSSYDLGENLRLVLLSVTEGEDKPLKYPTIFNSADLAVITKIDLAEAVEFDRAAAEIEHPKSSARACPCWNFPRKPDQGMDEWLALLRIRRRSNRAATVSVRSCEKIGSQAKAPAPLNRKSLCVNVGQTLPSANPARLPIFSQLLRLREPVLLGSSYFASTSLPSANPACFPIFFTASKLREPVSFWVPATLG